VGGVVGPPFFEERINLSKFSVSPIELCSTNAACFINNCTKLYWSTTNVWWHGGEKTNGNPSRRSTKYIRIM